MYNRHYTTRSMMESVSGVSRFRQDGSYKKKEHNHTKSDWRAHKGFRKDSWAKGEVFCKCGPGLKTTGNRVNRRWSKRMIHNEAWDSICYDKDMFVSSWDAC